VEWEMTYLNGDLNQKQDVVLEARTDNGSKTLFFETFLSVNVIKYYNATMNFMLKQKITFNSSPYLSH